jgi:hypothetical protein
MKKDRLEFKDAQERKCEVVRNGNDYHFYVNGFHGKSIRAMRPFFPVMAMRAFVDPLIWDAALLNGDFVEINN